MNAPFLFISSDHGWIGRIGWFNTFEPNSGIPGSPSSWNLIRIWGLAPVRFQATGWGPGGDLEQP